MVPANDEKWHKLRQAMNSTLGFNVIGNYVSKQSEIADNFVRLVAEEDYKLDNVQMFLGLFAIEAISVVCPGWHIQCLDDKNEDILNVSNGFMDGMHDTFFGNPFWRVFPTKGYRMLVNSQLDVYR